MSIAGFIVGFREGLESFLLLTLALKYLKTLKAYHLRINVFYGAIAGVVTSLIAGFLLNEFASNISKTAKIWESVFSFIAVLLITTLIFWMIKHSKDMKSYVKRKLDNSLSRWGVFAFSSIIVLREGAEVSLFTLAGDYSLYSVLGGVAISLLVAVLIYFSLIKVKLKLLFNITLIYLILQAAYLLGYSVHEGLSALKGAPLAEGHFLYSKAFDLSSGILNHKDGLIGLPMNVVLGWYSKPEWLPFFLHYGYASAIFLYWHGRLAKK